MYKNTLRFTLVLTLFMLIACSSESARHSGFVVKGKITNNTEKMLTLSEITPKGLVFLDTAAVAADGSFEFDGKLSEKTFCIINLPKGSVLLVADSASEIILSVDANTPETFGVNGSPDTEELRRLLQVNNKYMLQMRGLEAKYQQYGNSTPPPDVQAMIRNDYDSVMGSRAKELEEYALTAKPGIIPYFVTNFLMPEANFTFFEQVDKKFYAASRNSKYAEEHHRRVEMLRRTAIGQPAPDIVLNDPFGKPVALSSLRGKYVLLDFWASWCRPCRAESPNLVKLYNRYKSKGFDIFSVSLDDNHDAWTRAINDDKLLWTHVSDLKKWNSSVVNTYNIEGIPFTVLLDKDGRIVAKNLRGEELEKKLAELLGGF